MVKSRPGSVAVRDAERLLGGAAAGLPPAMLAAGADGYLRDRLVRACRAGAESEGAEFLRLEGDSLNAETLAGAFATRSLFGAARRIWIREGSKMAGAVEEMLLGWTEAPGDGVFVLLTTAREAGDLKFLQTLSSRAATVSCSFDRRDGSEWAETIAREEGLKLPSNTVEAILDACGDLLSYSQEIRKLAARADAEGRVPASALDVLREARASASLDRWASAVLSGTAAAARAETEVLARDGVGGTSALWAIAERALSSLDPQSFFYRRTVQEGPRLDPARARGA